MWDFWICGKCILGHFKHLKFPEKNGFSNFRYFFCYLKLYLDRTIHICSYVEPYMDRIIHICSYVELYLDRTIHICSYVDVAGGSRGIAGRRGGSPGVAGGRRRRRRRRPPNNSPIWPEPWTLTPRDQISRSGQSLTSINAYIGEVGGRLLRGVQGWSSLVKKV